MAESIPFALVDLRIVGMQNRLQFLHPKVGRLTFFPILPLWCGRHSARYFSFSDLRMLDFRDTQKR
jgi:hypothetical protein